MLLIFGISSHKGAGRNDTGTGTAWFVNLRSLFWQIQFKTCHKNTAYLRRHHRLSWEKTRTRVLRLISNTVVKLSPVVHSTLRYLYYGRKPFPSENAIPTTNYFLFPFIFLFLLLLFTVALFLFPLSNYFLHQNVHPGKSLIRFCHVLWGLVEVPVPYMF